jgi:tRNA(Arg) A34 adenosine deaminase TadA
MAKASVFHEGVLHVCESQRVLSQSDVSGRSVTSILFTPALALIYGLYEHFGTAAHFALRKPLVLDYPPTSRCLAGIKVGAKRWKEAPSVATPTSEMFSVRSHPCFPPLPAQSEVFWHEPVCYEGFLQDESHAAEALFARMAQFQSSGPLHARHRNVHAFLVAADGRILLEARNTNAVNRMRHAEVNLLHAWWARMGSPPPCDAWVAVSLKPCRMCAALLFEATRREGRAPIAIRYLEDDTGPLAARTAYEIEPEARGRMRRING